MALKVKNPKKNLADILIEKERLNESYDSSSAVSLQTLETVVEGEETQKNAENKAVEAEKDGNRPIESMPVTAPAANEQRSIKEEEVRVPNPEPAPVPNTQPVQQSVQPVIQQPVQQPVQQVVPQPAQQSITPVYERPIYDMDDYNPPRKKRGRPYQGYAENTHVQSIYVRNDLYEYIMINYVGHGRKHSSYTNAPKVGRLEY